LAVLAYRHLSERQENDAGPVSEPERQTILINAAKQVGPALFFSLIVIVVSFMPVFLLEAQEGRMFRPLAWTKTLAVGSSSILAITLVPVLMVMLIRGRLRPERANPISRITQAIYLPILKFCLRHRWLTIVVNLIFLLVTFPLATRLGSQFMPALFEGSTLYMPTASSRHLHRAGEGAPAAAGSCLRSFPEVASVFGAVGRSDSATDNAPLDMYSGRRIALRTREDPCARSLCNLLHLETAGRGIFRAARTGPRARWLLSLGLNRNMRRHAVGVC
jgi:Cu(I)/Ag(I) efflux system membrane protein CusA/SilA